MPDSDIFLQELKKWQDEATKWQQQVETTRQALNTRTATPQPTPSYLQRLRVAAPRLLGLTTTSLLAPKATFGGAAPPAVPEDLLQLQTDFRQATQNLGKSAWFTWFYSTAPEQVKSGQVNSLEDWLAAGGSNPQGILTDDDLNLARAAITRMKETFKPAGEAVPSFMEGEEPATADEEAVRAFLRGITPTTPMQTINTMTVQELAKALRLVPSAAMPLGMSDEEALKLMTLMDLPADKVREASEIAAAVEEYSKMAQEQENRIKEVLAGTAEWETPKMTAAERLKFIGLSPFQALADILQPYIEHVSYPISGLTVLTVQRLWRSTQGLEQNFAQLRAQGKNVWAAAGEAWAADDDIPWWSKLAIEIVTDPITWIPGWGLSKPAALAARIGLPKVSRAMIGLNRGMYTTLDIPFDLLKHYIRKFPKTLSQEVAAQSNMFADHLYAVMRHTNPNKAILNAEDFEKAIRAAQEAFSADPHAKLIPTTAKYLTPQQVLTNLGYMLADFDHITPERLLVWSNKLKGKLTSELVKDHTLVMQVNEALASIVNKTLPEEAAAKIIAGILGVDDNPAVLKLIIKDANAYLAKSGLRVNTAIQVAKTTTLDPATEAMQVLKNQQVSLLKKQAASKVSDGTRLGGIVLGLQKYVDASLKGKWQMAIDRFLVKPMSNAYLGNISYAVWNAFEGIGISLLEGVTPGLAKVHVARALFGDLVGAPPELREMIELVDMRASDVAQMLGTTKSQAISLLPGRIPESIKIPFTDKELAVPKFFAGKDWFEWLGKKWPEVSNVWGSSIKLNFFTKKYAQWLAELSYDISGKDLMAVFKRLMAEPPNIGKSSLGLSKDVLKDVMFYRMLTGDKAQVLKLLDDISNGALMQDQQLKIVRSYLSGSPRARALIEQDIAAGNVLKDLNSIRATTAKWSGESIKDIRARDFSIADSFSHLADQVDATDIPDADTLMNIFSNYRLMAQDAYNLPSMMMTHTMDEAAVLRKMQQWRKISALWKEQRPKMEAAVASIDASLERVKNKLIANSDKLTPEQADAMIGILDGMSARNALRDSALQTDRTILDEYWKLTRAQRTNEVSEQMWADRQANWMAYRQENAVLAGQEFLSGQNYARLYSKLPPERLLPVDATGRALSQDDVAKILGCNVDSLTQGLMDNTALTQFKENFVQIVKQRADSRPDLFKGVTEEKIGQVYDDILQSVGMRDGVVGAIETPIATMPASLDDIPTLFPFLGGKRSLAPQIIPSIGYVSGSFIDPFFGSGAISIAMQKSGLAKRIVTQEANAHLLMIYRVAKTSSNELAAQIKRVHEAFPNGVIDRKAGHIILDRFNSGAGSEIERAADYILLQRQAVSGNIAYTKTGKITMGLQEATPAGYRGKFTAQYEQKLQQSLSELRTIDVQQATGSSYLQMIDNAKPGDVVYLDPPYTGRTFNYPGETQVGTWDDAKLTAMLDAAKRASDRGVRVVISESLAASGKLESVGAKVSTIGKAYSGAKAGVGITEDIKGEILATLGPEPTAIPTTKSAATLGIDEQKILQEAESMRLELINLKLAGALSPSEQAALKSWVEGVAKGMDDVFGAKPFSTDVGLGEHLPTKSELADLEAQIRGYAELYNMSIEEARPIVIGEQLGKAGVVQDLGKINAIRDKVTDLAKGVINLPYRHPDYSSLESVIKGWFANSDNYDLQLMGKAAQQSPEYLAGIRKILREQYPSGYIRIYRGSGRAKGAALEREYTNVTSSRRSAKEFEESWNYAPSTQEPGFREKVAPSIDNVLVKVDDIVSIGSVEESELIIHTAVLRDRINNPIKVPATVTKEKWTATRQEALRLSSQDYYKAFADYSNQNLVDAAMRSVYPFWTYETYRWFFLPRTFIRHPGIAAAWGKYQDYSDYGYVHLPGLNLDINPFVGSVFGATFGLARHDFKSYYENLGELGESLDFWQRRGFFPNAFWSGLVSLTPVASGRPPELGGVLPPFHRFGLDLLSASNIKGVSDASNWLQDRVFHENFRDYYIATEVAAMQVEAGGGLIGGQSGVDLWNKLRDKQKLTEEEQSIWDTATTRASWYGVLRSQFPMFRLREEEYLEAYQQVQKIFEEQLGMTPEYQEYLWRHNLKPTDVVGGLPLDLKITLDQMWQWRIWFGRGQILMPPEISDLYAKQNKYWDKVKSFQADRMEAQSDVDTGFLTPTKELHFTGREWRDAYSSNWSGYTSKVDGLKTDPEFADAIDAMTPAGQVKLAKTLGFSSPVTGPMEEAIDLYFSIELKKQKDPYTGEEDYDYLGFWLNREAVRNALTPEQLADFEAYIRRYETPMEKMFREVTNKYLRGYRAIPRILLTDYSEQQKALIAEFYADTTTSARKTELRAVPGPEGRLLISQWESNISDARQRMREASPMLDFWLYVFGYVTKPRTKSSQQMVDNWEKDKTSVLSGY